MHQQSQGNACIEAPGEGAEDGVLHSQRQVREREIWGCQREQGNSLALLADSKCSQVLKIVLGNGASQVYDTLDPC